MFNTLRVKLLAAALLVSTSTVSAQDVMDSAFSPDWTGAYAGIFAGGLGGTVETDGMLLNDTDLSGASTGAYGGYNFGLDGVVFGFEGDLGKSWASGDGSASEDGSYRYAIDWTAHLRGRIGLAAEHALFYLSGGLAVASASLETEAGEDSQVHAGWTAGIGVEYALNELVTVRAEYLHDDYGTEVYDDGTDEHEIGLTSDSVRVGVAVKF